jgi:hypothetical protein
VELHLYCPTRLQGVHRDYGAHTETGTTLKGPAQYYISVCVTSKGLQQNYGNYQQHCVGRDSSVGIVTCYGLDGMGIESRRGRDFPHLSRQALRHTQFLVQGVPGHSQGVKQSGRDVNHPPHTALRLKNEYCPLELHGHF